MSDSDNIDYDLVARAQAKSMYANITISLVVAGIHLFMAIYGLSVFLETRPDLRKGRHRYVVISFFITFLVTFAGSLDAVWAFKLLFESTSSSDFIFLMEKYFLSWERWGSTCSLTLMVFIGDVLLVYRCYVIWKDRWYVSVLPVLTCIGALAMDIVVQSNRPNPTFFLPPYETAGTILTVSTNLIVTGMISVHLIRARRSLSKVLPSSQLTLYTGVVAILVESALPLSVFGLVYAVIILYTPKETTVGLETFYSLANVFSLLFYSFASLSPHMIIFRVTTGRSWVQQFPKADGKGGLSNSIEFAREPDTYSSFIQSVLNRDLGRSSEAGGEPSSREV
ncbi:hypothetical protein EST38_g9491 [Candolleomyces aberdarensis]|uniref:G protein-coupled receptor n=1 Tax=Candolleomyces aberdarensis TaxID=2316362 RepID=A0A4Q2D9S1_9AGAR|nr:hypothetical protein EST38_g9491 [Candolleomyces aberdarensis]